MRTVRKKATDRHLSSSEQAKAFSLVLEEEFGVPFTLFDASSGEVISLKRKSKQPQTVGPVSLNPPAVLALARDEHTRLTPLANHRYRLALLLYSQRKPVFVAAAELDSLGGAGELSAAARAREQAMLERWLQAVGERLRLTDQLLSFGPAISNCRHVRRLHAANEERTTHNQLLQAEKMRALSELAGGMAHDFNNSLCGVLGFLELALADKGLDPTIFSYLQSARTCTLDAAQTVRCLQNFARWFVKEEGVAYNWP